MVEISYIKDMFQLVQRPDVLDDLLKVSCTLYISV